MTTPTVLEPPVDTPPAHDSPVDSPVGTADLGTLSGERQSLGERIALGIFVAVPFLALLAAIPAAAYGLFSWHDAVLFVVFYMVSGHGVTIGLHRLFTHKSFKAKRGLRIALAIAGSLSIQGPVIRWVADHRRHHKFSDRDGDPHSPWRYGESVRGLTKGFFHAHVAWLFDVEQTPQRQYAPDLLKDRDIVAISKLFPLFVAISMLLPAVVGGLWTSHGWSWTGAATAFFWASLVRVALLHHVTWSINSICHMVGARPFSTRDHSGNVWWLAVLSHGESWHNLHHSDPTCARHGVLRGQVDTSARMIKLFETFGWAHSVRWPVASRLAAKRVPAGSAAGTDGAA